MVRTPGFIVPSSFSSTEEATEELRRRSKEAGFTPFTFDEFTHEDSQESTRMTTEVDNYLEHYGVKGMKWGRRSGGADSSSGGSGQKSRKELRALNRSNRKAAKQKRKDDWDNEVNTARNELEGKAEKLDKAQKEYKSNKATMGKVAAKQILREVEDDFISTLNVASLNTTKEAQVSMIAGVGLLALSAIVPVAAAAARDSW